MESLGRYASMRRLLAAAALASLALAFGVAALVLQHGTGTARGPVELGVDANPGGNTAISLGPAEGCISVSSGDTFDLDIFVSDVDNLVHWELYFTFDSSIVEMVNADMRMFLASNPWSSVKVEWVPISDGQHFLGAADTRLLGSSGSGVLARLTFEATGPGLSRADFLYVDDGTGRMVKGPRLTATGRVAVGDVTGDRVFDGPTHHGFIAVDENCPTPAPTPTPTPTPTPVPGEDGDDDSGLDSEWENELERVFGVDPDDTDAEGTEDGTTGDADDSEEGPASVVLRGESGPDASSSDEDSGNAQAGVRTSPSPSSSGGGLPLWAIGFIAAAVLVVAGGVGVYLAARAGGGFGR